ncbi:indolepyruvate ferredoxin oxidoreductase, partial [Patescibacteria group bacterium]|nr:indolepyruvate ferredoxin oxidoreductase [Patescibacteria group bacterium]
MADLTKLIPGQLALLQGNEAIARGALEAGVSFCAAYPGNPSSEILESLADSAASAGIYAEWSVNEKVALESAAAASYTGLRAMASMKQNGVNVAQDFICNLTISGSGPGGLVLITCDDPSGISSTNEQDARFIARLADLPLLEPATPAEALAMVKFAFKLSEQINNLVVLRSLSRLSHTRAGLVPGELPTDRPKPYWDHKTNYYTMPVVPLHQKMHEKLARAGQLMAQSGFNRYEGPKQPELLIIASGSSALYADEDLDMLQARSQAGILKLGCTWPLPAELILEHLANSDLVLFAEEVDPFLENEIKALYAQNAAHLGIKHFFGKASGTLPSIGENTPAKLAAAIAGIPGIEWQAVDQEYAGKAATSLASLMPPREFGFCPGCPHRASYWAIKQTLAVDGRQGLVSGDIGCYTLGVLPTGFRRVNSVHCMGSGLGISSGLGQLGRFGFEQPVVSVVGDSTFYHAALPALVNARWNNADYVLCVLDNSATAMTGFQPHPGTGQTASGQPGAKVDVESVCQAMGLPYRIVDPYDLAATQEALYGALQEDGGLRVLIFRRVCALVQGRQGGHPYRMKIDHEACRGETCGCNRFCSRVFRCPGLVFDEASGVAAIDEVTCVGCG